MKNLIATIDLQIDRSGKTTATVHSSGTITTFALPFKQACEKAMDIIEDDFLIFKEKSPCECQKFALQCVQ